MSLKALKILITLLLNNKFKYLLTVLKMVVKTESFEKLFIDLKSPEGALLLINKPLTWTSFDVVKKMRGLLRVKKIGHAGTLDPLATGLLLLATNKMLKKMILFQDLDKTYRGTLELGYTTDSFDLETKLKNPKEIKHLTPKFIKEKVNLFVGKIQQVPPLYSSVKVNGKKAYHYARAKQDVQLKVRAVHIHYFEVNIELPEIHFSISCSKGTYIRSLAHDLGQTLEVGAYLKSLRRTTIGEYDLKNAYEIDDIEYFIKNCNM